MTNDDIDKDDVDIGGPFIGKSSFIPDYKSMNAVGKIIGVGTWGCQIILKLKQRGIGNIDTIAVDLDAVAVQLSEAHHQFPIGSRLTRGLGAGGDLELGKAAALEARNDIKKLFQDTDILFILAGMGGGTGGGAAPVIAEIAKEAGALTIAIVTMPFDMERGKRGKKADEALALLGKIADTTIVISSDVIRSAVNIAEFRLMWEAVNSIVIESAYRATFGLIGVIKRPAAINLTFDDLEALMSKAGYAFIGHGSSANDSYEAARKAFNSLLLNKSIEKAKSLIIIETLGKNFSLKDAQIVVSLISEFFNPQPADFLIGVGVDTQQTDYCQVTVIAIDNREDPKELIHT